MRSLPKNIWIPLSHNSIVRPFVLGLFIAYMEQIKQTKTLNGDNIKQIFTNVSTPFHNPTAPTALVWVNLLHFVEIKFLMHVCGK